MEQIYIHKFNPLVKEEYGGAVPYLRHVLGWPESVGEGEEDRGRYWTRTDEVVARKNDWAYSVPHDVELVLPPWTCPGAGERTKLTPPSSQARRLLDPVADLPPFSLPAFHLTITARWGRDRQLGRRPVPRAQRQDRRARRRRHLARVGAGRARAGDRCVRQGEVA